MASSSDSYLAEGFSVSKPPRFDGLDYHYWSARMKLFMQSKSLETWEVVQNGDKKFKNAEGVEKPESEWTTEEKKEAQVNKTAMLYLVCSLSRGEYDKVSSCTSAKDIWDTLALAHEGTSQVKESKIGMLVHQYELFRMKEGESIDEMFARFQVIVNGLTSLGKMYSKQDHVRKILRSLPKRWRPKVTAIQEAKDLATLKLEELLGSLKIHELELDNEDGGPRKKEVAFKASQKKTSSSKKNEKSHESDGDSSSVEEEEVNYIARKLRRMWKKKFHKRSSDSKSYDSKGDKKKVTCFTCGKEGHYKNECPERFAKDKSRKKKEVMMVTWENVDDESPTTPLSPEAKSDSPDEANLCLMAFDPSNSEDSEDSGISLKVGSSSKDSSKMVNSEVFPKLQLSLFSNHDICYSPMSRNGHPNAYTRIDESYILKSIVHTNASKSMINKNLAWTQAEHGICRKDTFYVKNMHVRTNPQGPKFKWVPKLPKQLMSGHEGQGNMVPGLRLLKAHVREQGVVPCPLSA